MGLKIGPLTVGGKTHTTRWFIPVISTSAYTAKDAMGVLFEVGFGSNSGILQTILLIDQDLENDGIDVLFFRDSITRSADNAVFDLADGEVNRFIGHVPINVSDYADLSDNSVATVRNIGMAFSGLTNGRVFVQLVNRSAGTYTAVTDLRIAFVVLQD